MLSARQDFCVVAPVGVRVLRDRRGIDSDSGWLQVGATTIAYEVGYGPQRDWQHGDRTDLPQASDGRTRVHGWVDPSMAAVIVEGLRAPHGTEQKLWLRYDPADRDGQPLAVKLARNAHYCRDGGVLDNSQWREARLREAKACLEKHGAKFPCPGP